MNFFKAQTLFLSARNKDKGKPIGNNTRIVQLSETCFGIKLHNTIIVAIHRDGNYILNANGWYTVTTKKRINQYSPVKVFQKNHKWFIDKQDELGNYIPFVSGMIV